MTHRQALDYLRSLGNEVLNMDLGLRRMELLVEAMGSPHRAFPSVLVAGTNGKGSVALFLHNILVRAGLRCGLYTSPHIDDLCERYRIGETEISADEFASGMAHVLTAIEAGRLPSPPTYFETLTGICFDWFARARVEIAILEIGMGGRLDSTNVVDPVLSIFTPVGLDHQRFLGDTEERIAAEKAGILRSGRPAISSTQSARVRTVLDSIAGDLGAPLEFLHLEEEPKADGDGHYSVCWKGLKLCPGVRGRHQARNAALAAQAALLLSEQGFKGLDPAAIQEGIQRTAVRGRIDQICDDPVVILDGAHNPDAASALRDYLERHTEPPRALIVGMMADKDLDAASALLSPLFGRRSAVELGSPRSASLEALLRAFPGASPQASVQTALDDALASDARTIVAAGSFSLLQPMAQALKRSRSMKA